MRSVFFIARERAAALSRCFFYIYLNFEYFMPGVKLNFLENSHRLKNFLLRIWHEISKVFFDLNTWLFNCNINHEALERFEWWKFDRISRLRQRKFTENWVYGWIKWDDSIHFGWETEFVRCFWQKSSESSRGKFKRLIRGNLVFRAQLIYFCFVLNFEQYSAI